MQLYKSLQTVHNSVLCRRLYFGTYNPACARSVLPSSYSSDLNMTQVRILFNYWVIFSSNNVELVVAMKNITKYSRVIAAFS